MRQGNIFQAKDTFWIYAKRMLFDLDSFVALQIVVL